MFLHVSVILSTGRVPARRRGACSWGIWSWGVPASVRGVSSWGGSALGGLVWGVPPPGDACSGGVSAPGGGSGWGVPAPGGGAFPGGLVLGGCLVKTPHGYWCGRYASYWNAFFLFFGLVSTFTILVRQVILQGFYM